MRRNIESGKFDSAKLSKEQAKKEIETLKQNSKEVVKKFVVDAMKESKKVLNTMQRKEYLKALNNAVGEYQADMKNFDTNKKTNENDVIKSNGQLFAKIIKLNKNSKVQTKVKVPKGLVPERKENA